MLPMLPIPTCHHMLPILLFLPQMLPLFSPHTSCPSHHCCEKNETIHVTNLWYKISPNSYIDIDSRNGFFPLFFGSSLKSRVSSRGLDKWACDGLCWLVLTVTWSLSSLLRIVRLAIHHGLVLGSDFIFQFLASSLPFQIGCWSLLHCAKGHGNRRWSQGEDIRS